MTLHDLQWFLTGVMVAYTPTLIFLAFAFARMPMSETDD